MPVPLIVANTLVTALDWWNPLSSLVNTLESGLTSEITARAAGDTAINNRLALTIAATGISDLPSWKSSTDTTVAGHTTSITALNTAVGIPYGAGTSLATRVTALEAIGAPPYVHVYQVNGATQNIVNTTHTALTFTAEIKDTNNTHSNVTNTSRVTPTQAGMYECHGTVSFIGAAAGMFMCQFRKNGAVVLGAAPYQSQLATNQASLSNTAQAFASIQCNGTTDYIELWAWHVFGGTTATFSNTTDEHSAMLVRYVCP